VDDPRVIDLGGAIRAVRLVPGLLALLLFSTFNNFLGGVFMALMDPYGLTLMSVEAWGLLVGFTSLGFIVGGIVVARRGLGANPLRTLLLANVVMWTVTIVFPIRSEILPLALGFFIYLVVAPVAEASEQTIIQRVVPFSEQGRVFGFGQSLETAASPVTAFLIGPIAQFWVIPWMSDGWLADAIGPWFGTGPDRGMALIFIIAGIIGLFVTFLALRSRPYRELSARYATAPDVAGGAASGDLDEPAAAMGSGPA
jgi:DHA3 family multidrug efflux protein-like MFS transporter